MTDNLKDLDNLKPIDHAVIAKPHTPVYKMHRYFARRPWSVFRSLIENYSNPGSIILDPFCGGGVTVVEGLRLGRKVIGVDINPLATFITRLEVQPVELRELQLGLDQVLAETKQNILQLYACKCPICGKPAYLDWLEWSNVYECPSCHREVAVALQPKIKWGTYKCSKPCNVPINITDATLVGEIPIQVKIHCENCNKTKTHTLPKEDADRFKANGRVLARLETKYAYAIPDDLMSDKLELRRPYNAHLKKYADFLTLRNRVACAMLLTSIRQQPQSIRQFLVGTFISTINWAVRMCVLKKGSPAGWAAANFWTPQNGLEINVWNAFRNRAKATLKGKEESEANINEYELIRSIPSSGTLGAADVAILTKSATHLPLKENSVDAIVTDPPYGGNVMYTELGNFYAVWVKDTLGLTPNALINDDEEAIVSKPHKKGLADYRQLMHQVFKECHRILKPRRWMVMTFHNREFRVWNAIHLAAHDAGFVLAEHDGMIYQPPIKQFTTTIYQYRAGSMLGDFILSFQKVDKPTEFKAIEYAEIGRHIERLAGEAVIYHNGATLSTIYMKLIPWLLNNNLLDRIKENDVIPYLQRNFEERSVEKPGYIKDKAKKPVNEWHLKSTPDESIRHDLESYSQQHYKTSYSDAMRVIPVEARIEYLIRRLLYREGQATQDEVINEIYSNLINSNAADLDEIPRVLHRIAEMRDSTEGMVGTAKKGVKKRKVWRLKEDVLREQLFTKVGVDIGKELQIATNEESDHDLAIARLVDLAGLRKLKAHIGKTEQGKYIEFRKMSSDLPKQVRGMPKAARKIVEQIDVLWHNGGKGIVAAFEVERTTTITSGIDRFRNLLTAAPESEIELYLVVPKSRGNEVRNKLGSPANRKDGLHKKIGYIFLEDLDIRHAAEKIDFEKIKRFIDGGKNESVS